MSAPERWLVTGASGLFGRALCALLVERGHDLVGVRQHHPIGLEGVNEVALDVTEPREIRRLVEDWRPDVVVNAAGLTNVDLCEADEAKAVRVHVDAAAAVAQAAAAVGARLLHISTDHLWDGSQSFVDESTPPGPINAYARTKLLGERAVLGEHPSPLVVRTNFFGSGPPWRRSFSDWILDALRAGATINAFADVFFTPVALGLLCPLIVELAGAEGASGVLHVAGSERLSKLDFARRLAAVHGMDATAIVPASMADAHLGAPRPRDMSLHTGRARTLLGRQLPSVDASLRALVTERDTDDRPPLPSREPEQSLEQR